jgi:phage terminase small subunit
MGRRGPAPAPVEIQVLRGARESRINRLAPRPVAGLPERPADLLDGAGEVWDEVMAQLGPTGAITRVDRWSVRHFAESEALHLAVVALYKATGSKPMIRNRAGELVANPILREVERTRSAANIAGREIGATPSSRSMIRARPIGPGDAFDEFLDRPKAARPRGRAS